MYTHKKSRHHLPGNSPLPISSPLVRAFFPFFLSSPSLTRFEPSLRGRGVSVCILESSHHHRPRVLILGPLRFLFCFLVLDFRNGPPFHITRPLPRFDSGPETYCRNLVSVALVYLYVYVHAYRHTDLPVFFFFAHRRPGATNSYPNSLSIIVHLLACLPYSIEYSINEPSCRSYHQHCLFSS